MTLWDYSRSSCGHPGLAFESGQDASQLWRDALPLLEPTGLGPGSLATKKLGRSEKRSVYKGPPVRAAKMDVPVENP